ncbi:MAG: response regulator [Burkholderiales bacterium]
MNVKPQLNKILYVEDEADIREVGQIGLEDVAGFTLRVCESGMVALEALRDFAPDMFLLDVMMPQMDGITLYGKIREKSGFAHTPVVFMTARVQPSDIARYMDLGAAGVIAKPFDPMSLGTQLTALWDQHHADHSARAAT